MKILQGSATAAEQRRREAEDTHTLSVLVENKPGVLTRISGMFSRRGYNIHSLTVGTTEDPRVSRMTIVVGGEAVQLEQIVKQLNKLVHVLRIQELEHGQAVERELLLVKIAALSEHRAEVSQLVAIFAAKVVDVDHETMTIQASSSPAKLDSLLDLLAPFGVREIARTGTLALGRGSQAILDGSKVRLSAV